MFFKPAAYAYQREQEKRERAVDSDFSNEWIKKRRTDNFRFWFRYAAGQITLLTVGFLLGRAFLLQELLPFGVAIVAAAFAIYRESALTVLLGAAFGLMFITAGWDLVMHLISLIVVGAVALSLPHRSGNRFRLLLGGTVFAMLLIFGVGYVAITQPTTYNYVKVLFESIFASLLAVAYLGAFEGLRKLIGQDQISVEKIFCLVLLLTSVVAGAGQLQWGVVSPGGILAGLVVLIACYTGGAGLGSAAGAVMGVLPGFAFSTSPAALGAFAFAGFLGGACRSLGKIGICIGFLLGNTLLTVYLGSDRDIIGMMFESSGSVLIFLLVPGSLLAVLQKYLPVTGYWITLDSLSGAGEKRSGTERVRRWRAVFEEISLTYKQISGALEPEREVHDEHATITKLKNMVCAGCALYRVCWEREKQQTHLYLHDFLKAVECNGRADVQDLDENFRLRCSRNGELIIGANCLYQLERMNRFWESRLSESRCLISEQLRGLSGVVENLCREMETENETWFRRAEFFKRELKQEGMPVASLALFPNSVDFEIEVSMPVCGGIKKCWYDVAPLLSRLSELSLMPAWVNCLQLQDDFCVIRLYPDLKNRLGIGLACHAGKGNDVSGDSYAILQLNDGRVALMLSDGMGSGPTAAAESRTCLALLQQLLKVGFGWSVAIRIINSVMMRWSPEDNFATVDMCLVDLYNGKAEIVKIGASPSFMVRKNRISAIKASSLPVGIVDEMNIFSVETDIKHGDMLVMVTDGVTDVYDGEGEREEWITSVLDKIIDLPPQEVADLILRLAISGTGEEKRKADDMTVLVVCFEEISEN